MASWRSDSGAREQGDRTNRRIFCVLLAAYAILAIANATAQPVRKPARVGILSGSGVGPSAFTSTFKNAMSDLGWIENRDVIYVERSADGDVRRIEHMTQELLAEKVHVIRTGSADVAIAAARVASKVPIVFATAADPVGAGAVVSLARPGGNITGMSSSNAELTTKRIELLLELRPQLKRLAMLYAPSENLVSVKAVTSAARALGLEFRTFYVERADAINDAFTQMTDWKADGLLVPAPVLLVREYAQIISHAARVRIPVVYARSDLVERGGLMSYSADFSDNHRRAAWYVDKILKGARPADLPVQQPTKFELAINLKTAKALGLTIPQSILVRADRVIE